MYSRRVAHQIPTTACTGALQRACSSSPFTRPGGEHITYRCRFLSDSFAQPLVKGPCDGTRCETCHLIQTAGEHQLLIFCLLPAMRSCWPRGICGVEDRHDYLMPIFLQELRRNLKVASIMLLVSPVNCAQVSRVTGADSLVLLRYRSFSHFWRN